eukprot:gene5683-5630_t
MGTTLWVARPRSTHHRGPPPGTSRQARNHGVAAQPSWASVKYPVPVLPVPELSQPPPASAKSFHTDPGGCGPYAPTDLWAMLADAAKPLEVRTKANKVRMHGWGIPQRLQLATTWLWNQRGGIFRQPSMLLILSDKGVLGTIPLPPWLPNNLSWQSYRTHRVVGVKFVNTTTILGSYVEKYKTGAYSTAKSGNLVFLWNLVMQRIEHFPISSHHDVEYSTTSRTFLTLSHVEVALGRFADVERLPYAISHPSSNTTVSLDDLLEYSETGKVVWRWDSASVLLPYLEGFPAGRIFLAKANPDFTHGNSIFWDTQGQCIYYNCRNLNTFFKISKATG